MSNDCLPGQAFASARTGPHRSGIALSFSSEVAAPAGVMTLSGHILVARLVSGYSGVVSR